MPLAEQSIIAPGEIPSKAPLKKSTVAWMAAFMLVLAVASAVMLPALRSSGQDVPRTATSNAPKGQADQIDGEFNRAKQQAALAAANRPAPAASMPGRPIVPEAARRDDNSGALYGNKLQGVGAGSGAAAADAAAIEIDAQARKSTSLKFDYADAQPAAGITAAATRVAQAPSEPGTAAPEPSAGGGLNARVIAAMEEAKRAQLPTLGPGADKSWLKEFGADDGRKAPLRPYKVSSEYMLMRGKVIPAVLGRDLNTDLPGIVTACTTLDIYDSIVSRHLLIPRGSCLQGEYSNAVSAGQERILFAFKSLVMPDGQVVEMPGSQGSDLSGASGLAGDVNNHFFKMFSTSLLIALLAERVERNKQASTNQSGSSGASSAAGQVLVDVSRGVLDRNRTIPPTITVEKGTRINVEVTRDFEFPGPYRR